MNTIIDREPNKVLQQFSDDALIEEVKRRGIRPTRLEVPVPSGTLVAEVGDTPGYSEIFVELIHKNREIQELALVGKPTSNEDDPNDKTIQTRCWSLKRNEYNAEVVRTYTSLSQAAFLASGDYFILPKVE